MHEKIAGSANALYAEEMARAQALMPRVTRSTLAALCQETVAKFDSLELANDRSKPRVGVVGEILVKFHPTANNQVVEVIESEGCEAVVPGLVDFFMYNITTPVTNHNELGDSSALIFAARRGVDLLNWMRKPADDALAASRRFTPSTDIYTLAEKAEEIVSLCNHMGEGWLLTAEMLELIETGAPNIICTQPFACLPNHVVGRGVIKELRRRHPESNIVAVDYDPGASEVNQLNRIKLMVAVAKHNFEQNVLSQEKN